MDSNDLPNVIILCGKKGSGKDTIADYLVSKYSYTKVAFADELKSMIRRIDPIVGYSLNYLGNGENGELKIKAVPIRVSGAFALCYDNEIHVKEKYPEYRNFMQKLGTNGVREIDPDFWIKHTIEKARSLLNEGKRVVITDARFDNESNAAYAISNSVLCLEVIRPSIENDEYSNHSSETGISNSVKKKIFDPIENSGSIKDLYAKIESVLNT